MKERIFTDDAPKANTILSQAIISNGFIFVSGQIHSTPDGQIINGSTQDKVAQIIKNIQAILKAANAKLDDIVKVVIYTTDISLIPEINETYPTYFTEPYPAREAVCVEKLPLGASIEIGVIAEKSV